MRVWEEFYREGGGGYDILCMEKEFYRGEMKYVTNMYGKPLP